MKQRSYENQPRTSKLVELFDVIRDPKNLQAFSPEKNEKPLFADKQSIDQARGEINDAWDSIFHLKEFLTALKTPVRPETRKYLKKVRKFGVMKKFAYTHLTTEKFAPETFHIFIKKLGELNDALDAGTKYENIAKEVVVLAKKQDDSIEPPLQSLESAQLKQNTLNMTQEVLKTIQNDVLPVDVFHNVRKDIRNIMNLFQLETIRALGSPAHHVFLELFELSHDLGQEHDIAVHKDLHAQEKYETQTQTITPELRSRIQKTLSKAIALLIPAKPFPSHAQASAHRALPGDDWTSVHTS